MFYVLINLGVEVVGDVIGGVITYLIIKRFF